jgi:hypothetical protein
VRGRAQQDDLTNEWETVSGEVDTLGAGKGIEGNAWDGKVVIGCTNRITILHCCVRRKVRGNGERLGI